MQMQSGGVKVDKTPKRGFWSKMWNEEIKKANKLSVPNGGWELNRKKALKGTHLQASKLQYKDNQSYGLQRY